MFIKTALRLFLIHMTNKKLESNIMHSVGKAVGKYSCKLLVGMKTGTTFLEGNLTTLNKNYTCTHLFPQQSHSQESTLKINLQQCKKNMHKVIHCCMVCNCKISEATQMINVIYRSDWINYVTQWNTMQLQKYLCIQRSDFQAILNLKSKIQKIIYSMLPFM